MTSAVGKEERHAGAPIRDAVQTRAVTAPRTAKTRAKRREEAAEDGYGSRKRDYKHTHPSLLQSQGQRATDTAMPDHKDDMRQKSGREQR